MESLLQTVRLMESLLQTVRVMESLLQTVRVMESLLETVRVMESLLQTVRVMESLLQTAYDKSWKTTEFISMRQLNLVNLNFKRGIQCYRLPKMFYNDWQKKINHIHFWSKIWYYSWLYTESQTMIMWYLLANKFEIYYDDEK